MHARKTEHTSGMWLRRLGKAIVAVVASTAMLTAGAYAAPVEGTDEVALNAADTRTVISDANTTGMYAESLGDNNSTRYAGRVWTDKSVSTEDMSFTGQISDTVSKGESDFLVSYSVLATSQQITKLPKVPVDVVFVLDFSASMTWGVNSTVVANQPEDSRIYAMVEALNRTVDSLVKDSDPAHPNRIGIAYFNQVGYTLLPLTELSSSNLQHVHDRDGDNVPEYLDLTRFQGERETDVTCYIGNSAEVATTYSKTNIQYGLFQGMSMLADEQNTTFEYDGETYTRIPNVVLMSDGAPTTISDAYDASGSGTSSWNPRTGSWWEELDRNGNDSIGWGDNDRAWSANGMMPMLTAQYLKNKINSHYRTNASGLDNADQADTSMYTIGFGINEQTDSMVALANMVLNPQANWDRERYRGNTYEQHRGIIDQWAQYVGGDSADLQYVTDSLRTPHYYQAGHPWNDANDPNTPVPDYVDRYFPANSAGELEDAFREITNAITESAKVPTETSPSDPIHSGYITYTDPIGDYMHVDDVKTLIYANQRFNRTGNPTVSGNTTTYVFSGQVTSPVYGNHNLSEISITVETDRSGSQTLKVQIPASVIPVRVNEVDVRVDGTIERNDSNNVMPLRLIYGVSLNDNVIKDGVIDTTAVSSDYINSHSRDGKVSFYSNRYSSSSQDGGTSTVGDATVEFEPSDDNPFYFVQENIPLYEGGTYDSATETLTNGQLATGPFDPNKTYYFPITFYEGTGEQSKATTVWIARPASQMVGYVDNVNGNLQIRAGAPRLGNLTDLSRTKSGDQTVAANATGTATQRLYPTFVSNPGTSDPHAGHFTVYLGNNGLLQVPTTQPLTLTAEQSLTVVKNLEGNNLSGSENDANNFGFIVTPQATANGPTAKQAAAKLTASDTTDDASDGTLHFRNKAAQMTDNVAKDIMTPITKGLTFTADDVNQTFTYQVKEDIPNPRNVGYVYDEAEYTVTYTVTLVNGQLSVAVAVGEVSVDSGSSPTVTFNNKFSPISSLPLTGDGATSRTYLLFGGGVLLLAGAAWLLARRRRV